ncbi:aspartyl protease family protein [Bdellovibrio sp. HCB337]|uniref:aspartyl protease family protein n=1 Tax=Bdellovibrio sp. HCB337 TaxID=3394358 RepID=UPI0039A4D502
MVKNTIRLWLNIAVLMMFSQQVFGANLAWQQDSIPFELIDNRIFMQIHLNGQGPFAMVLDTGASNIFDTSLVRRLGLSTSDSGLANGGGANSVATTSGQVALMSFGNVSLSNQKFLAMDLSAMKNAIGFPRLDGFIGYEVFSQYVVEINYDTKTLSFLDPSTYNYQGTGTVVPFEFHGTTPVVHVNLDGIAGLFWLDTGDRSSMTLTTPFIRRNNLVSVYQPPFEMITGWGVGGALSTYLVRTKNITFAGENISNAIVRLPTATTGGMAVDYGIAGTLGNGILKKFNTVVDYKRKRVILERNTLYSQPDLADRSGMWLIQAGANLQVLDVVKDGPAWQAGLRQGVYITAVEGKPTASISLPDLRTQLSDPNLQSVKVTISSPLGGEIVQINLKNMIP